eukprot:835938-Rhodomonas_salina.1
MKRREGEERGERKRREARRQGKAREGEAREGEGGRGEGEGGGDVSRSHLSKPPPEEPAHHVRLLQPSAAHQRHRLWADRCKKLRGA